MAAYVTVEDADIYFDSVLFPEPWTTTDEATKQKALVAATRKIDALSLIGRKVYPEQALEFPRALYSHSYGVWVEEDEVSQEVKDATCEEALSMLKGGTEANKRAELQRQGVTSFSLGPLSETYSGGYTEGGKLGSQSAAQFLARYTNGGRVIG